VVPNCVLPIHPISMEGCCFFFFPFFPSLFKLKIYALEGRGDPIFFFPRRKEGLFLPSPPPSQTNLRTLFFSHRLSKRTFFSGRDFSSAGTTIGFFLRSGWIWFFLFPLKTFFLHFDGLLEAFYPCGWTRFSDVNIGFFFFFGIFLIGLCSREFSPRIMPFLP